MSAVDSVLSGIIAFREGLEAILIVIILLLYLRKSQQTLYRKYIYLGVGLAIVASLGFSFAFNAFAGGFEGTSEQIFEGVTFIISGFFILTLVLWMSREGPKMQQTLEEKAGQILNSKKALSLTGLSFIIIVREGIELVLLLTGVQEVGTGAPWEILIWANLGLLIALVIGFLVYFGVRTFNISKFFKITNILLILFAAGLITSGLHEFIEAGLLNPIIGEVWNLKAILPETFPDNNPVTLEVLEVLGSFLKSLFGYNANPSLLEVIAYPALLGVIGGISYRIWKTTTLIKQNSCKEHEIRCVPNSEARIK